MNSGVTHIVANRKATMCGQVPSFNGWQVALPGFPILPCVNCFNLARWRGDGNPTIPRPQYTLEDLGFNSKGEYEPGKEARYTYPEKALPGPEAAEDAP